MLLKRFIFSIYFMVYVYIKSIEKIYNFKVGQEYYEFEGIIVQFEVQRFGVEDGFY